MPRNDVASASASSVPLNLERIVSVAQAIARQGGIQRISMRTVADEIGVSPMALYRYVGTKDRLVKLVADAVVSEVPQRPSEPSEWRTGLIDGLNDYRKRVAQYPGLASVLLHGGLLPHARARVAWQLEMLESAGFSPSEAENAFAMFHLLMLGRLTVDEAKRTRIDRGPTSSHDVRIDHYLQVLQGEDALDQSTKVLLDALEDGLRARKKRPRR
jgi:AcrR family transcriptional regulator